MGTYYSGKSLSWMSPRVVCRVAELLTRELPEDCVVNVCVARMMYVPVQCFTFSMHEHCDDAY